MKGDGSGAAPTSTASQPPSYRDKLSPELRKQVDHAREIQKIDPCSLIDLEAAGRLATIASVGTDTRPINCEVEYEVPKQPSGDAFDSYSEVPGLPHQLNGGQRYPDRDSGETPHNIGSMCFMGLFTGYEDAEGKETISYSLTVSSGPSGTKDQPPRCQDLESVVNASRSLTAHPTTRSESRRIAQSKLMTIDPCAVVDVLSRDQKLEVTGPISPFGCVFRTEGTTGSATKRSVTLMFEEPDIVRRALAYAKSGRSSTSKYVEVLGMPADLGSDCRVIAYLDPDHPVTGSDPMSKKPWVPAVMVGGEDTDPGCQSIVTAATEVVRLYKEAK